MPLPKRKIKEKNKRKPISLVRKITNPEKIEADFWKHYGYKRRFKEVYINQLKKRPINFLLKNKNKKPNIMVLGAGFGNDIIKLNSFLNKNKIQPSIDVFSLHYMKNLPFQKIINKDYSREMALEELYYKGKKGIEVLKQTKTKYDLVVAPLSVGVHTNHPVYNAFTSALMLKKGGQLYFEIPTPSKETIQKIINQTRNKNKKKIIKKIYSKLTNFKEIFNRMINVYNKKKSSKYKFKVDLLKNTKDQTGHYIYYRIRRIN